MLYKILTEISLLPKKVKILISKVDIKCQLIIKKLYE